MYQVKMYLADDAELGGGKVKMTAEQFRRFRASRAKK